MTHIGKRLAALLVLCALVLCGCGRQEQDEPLPKLVIGSDNYEPYFYLDEDGSFAGIDVEIATEACRRMGYEPEFQKIAWQFKDILLEQGTVDCLWGCFSMSGREYDYQWAGPYAISRQVIAVDAGSDIYTMGDLAGKTIAVQSTGKPEDLFLHHRIADIPEFGAIISLEDRGVQYAALDCGYVDAVATHEMAILQYMEYGAEFRILDKPLLVTGIGVAFSNNDNRGLAQRLTETFAQMRQDGTLQEILGRYLEHPETYLEVESLGQ